MKVRVNITPDVLERSKMCGLDGKRIIESCMLQVAFSDLFPECVVLVSSVNLLGRASLGKPSGDEVILPEIAISNRRRFDSLQPHLRVLMTPFSFEIEVPEYVIERIGLSQIYKVLSESSTLEMVM